MARVRFAWLAGLLMVGACTTEADLDRSAAEPRNPDPYRAELQDAYLLLAKREFERFDFVDADAYLRRADAAAGDAPVGIADIYDYRIHWRRLAIARDARDRLKRLYDGGRLRAPRPVARAQAMFECLLEELEEGHQTGDITWCREQFEAAVTAARQDAGLDADWGIVLAAEDGHVGAIALTGDDGAARVLDSPDAAGFVHAAGDARAAPLSGMERGRIDEEAMRDLPSAPTRYVVYFGSASTEPDAAADKVLAAVVADAAARPAPDIELVGHADKAAGDAVNQALSLARARTVRDRLLALGAPADAFLIYASGESAPAVDTPDGAAEARNRRVEIVVR